MLENQTQFTNESPFYEEVYLPAEEVNSKKKSFFKTKKALLLLIPLVLILLVAVGAMMPKRKLVPTVEPTPTPVITDINLNQYEQRINTLEEELDLADPTDTVLPFPAVDMNIYLDGNQ